MHVRRRSFHDCAIASPEVVRPANFIQAADRFTSRRTRPFRVHRDEESAQTIASGMGELHLEIYMERIKREYASKGSGRPAASRLTARPSSRRRLRYTHEEADRRLGPVRPRGRLHRARCRKDAVEPYEFVNDIAGGSIPKEIHSPPATRASRKRSRRLAHRLPIVGRPRRHHRRPAHRRRLQRHRFGPPR